MSEERIKGRRDRIALLQKAINDAGENKPIKKVLAEFCVKSGVTEYTAKKYLTLLRDAGLID